MPKCIKTCLLGACVILNLSKLLRKRDKKPDFSSILSLFAMSFDKFNNAEAWMLDTIYHMKLDLL